MLTDRDNFLQTARFQNPDRIPMSVHVSDGSWDEHRGDMERMAIKNPDFFPHVKPGWRDYENYKFHPAHRKGEVFTDNWGCQWVTPFNGIEGVVTHSPLADWSSYDGYAFPDIETMADRSPRDWGEEAARTERARAEGRLVSQGLPHGFLFLRLTYLRGFDNALCDMADEDPRFVKLFDYLLEYNLELTRRYLAMGLDIMNFAEDLGTQTGPIVSPDMFDKWFVPAYARLMTPCREAGVLTGFHSDGKTLSILDHQIRAGVNIVNPQDLANGIDELAKHIKGRACINLDIDRQSVVPFGTSKDIAELIEEEVKKLGGKNGGLMMVAGIYPPTPPENVDALCAALRKFRTYWWE